jgi:hypothetical protein
MENQKFKSSEGVIENRLVRKTKVEDIPRSSKPLFEEETEEADDLFDPLIIDKKEKIFSGSQGKMIFQLQKSFKGDKRFELDERFVDDIQEENLPEAALLQYNKDEMVDFGPYVDISVIQKEVRTEIDRYRVLLDTIVEEPIRDIRSINTKNQFTPTKRFDPTSKASQNLLIKPDLSKKNPAVDLKPKLKFKRSELIVNKEKLQNQINPVNSKKIKKNQKKNMMDLVKKSKPAVFEINFKHLKGEYGLPSIGLANDYSRGIAPQAVSLQEFRLFE